MEAFSLVFVLVGLALFAAFPFLATRSVLQCTAQSFADPRLPEAALAVRRAARACLGFWVITGALFSLWCYYKSETYRAGGGWIDLGAGLWSAACFLPIWPLLQVLVANSMPVRVKIAANQLELGFSRCGS